MAIKDRFRNIPERKTSEPANDMVQVRVDENSVTADLIKSLSKKIASIPVWFEYSKDEQQSLISSYINAKLLEMDIKFSDEEKERFVTLFLNSVFGFGALDFLIVREDVSTIFVSQKDGVEIEKAGRIEKSDIELDSKQFNKIKDSLINASGVGLSFGIINLKIENLFITLILPPISEPKIIIKKLARRKVDLDYLAEIGVIPKGSIEFLRTVLANKKNVIVSGKLNSGKTKLLTAMLDEISSEKTILLQESPVIEARENISSYSISALDESGFGKLVSAVLNYKSEYLVSDLNDAKYANFILNASSDLSGFVSTIRANSVTSVIAKLSSSIMFYEKCTEKAAKAFVAEVFDYIIQLECGKPASIVALSLNKAGSLVVSEVEIPENNTISAPSGSRKPSNADWSSFRGRFQ